MSNMAEGFERDGNREFLQFLAQAKGSCGELRAHLYVGWDQGYLSRESFDEMLEAVLRISRMTSRLMSYLRTSPMKGRKFIAADSAESSWNVKPGT
jgi:four helix bundle protein